MRNRLRAAALAALLGAVTSPLGAAEPAPPRLEFAFEELVTLGPAQMVGESARGKRVIIPITGGTFEGPGIKGTVVPGGWDWQLIRTDGCIEVKADYMIRTDDGVTINVLNTGVICPPAGGVDRPVRTTPVFEAPRGKYEWLSQAAFVGTLELAGSQDKPAVRLRFYKAL